MEKNFQILRDSESLNRLLDYLEDCEHDFVSFDIETNSNVEATARVIGIGVCCYVDEAFYIPLAEFDKTKNSLISLHEPEFESGFVKELLQTLLRKKLIMHNGVFDIVTMWRRYGIDLTPALHADTILMKHTVDEERPFGLKDLAIRYQAQLGLPGNEAANQEQLDLKASVISNGGKWTKEQKDIYKGDLTLIGKYCCADVDISLRMFDFLEQRMETEGFLDFFYNQEVMPLYREATIPMKQHGVFIDIEYFKGLEKDLERGIMELTNKVFDQIEDDIQPLVREMLDKKIKETRTGKFAEGVLQYYELPVPSNKKTGKPTLAKSALQSLKLTYPDHVALEWLLHSPNLVEVEEEVEFEEKITVDGEEQTQIIKKKVKSKVPDPNDPGPKLPSKVVYAIKKKLFVEDKPDLPHVFNLASSQQLSWLLFDKYKCEPKSYSRQTEAPSVDQDSLEFYDHLPFMKDLIHLKKEEKLLSTYVKPILEKHIDGWLYPSMLQFGTTSGRYSCAGGLNLQTLPRDDKRVKRGFISPPGYKVVNADFSSLEPRIFSWVSGDPGLKGVWIKGLDLYSQIAIDVFGLEGVSARETDENYLKKVAPEERQKVKEFALAVPYGANAWRIAGLTKVHPKEAEGWINKYLESYPMLSDYMQNQELQARGQGFVTSQFGRTRHLPEAKEMFKKFGPNIYNKRSMTKRYGDFGESQYYKYRNLMNNSKNSPIQMTAAHVCNVAMIKLARAFKKHNIDGWIALQVHDEITCIVREHQADLAARLLKDAMENNDITRQIDIPIVAEPIISTNFAEAK